MLQKDRWYLIKHAYAYYIEQMYLFMMGTFHINVNYLNFRARGLELSWIELYCFLLTFGRGRLVVFGSFSLCLNDEHLSWLCMHSWAKWSTPYTLQQVHSWSSNICYFEQLISCLHQLSKYEAGNKNKCLNLSRESTSALNKSDPAWHSPLSPRFRRKKSDETF